MIRPNPTGPIAIPTSVARRASDRNSRPLIKFEKSPRSNVAVLNMTMTMSNICYDGNDADAKSKLSYMCLAAVRLNEQAGIDFTMKSVCGANIAQQY